MLNFNEQRQVVIYAEAPSVYAEGAFVRLILFVYQALNISIKTAIN